jgi:hypothetical protein
MIYLSFGCLRSIVRDGVLDGIREVLVVGGLELLF